ncbi:sulfite exporter TauE/SafE family protein [Niallia taxi]|uniref:Probable membrane transporter protein n=1 Tax=Niallia taxi TaxID=2499688 RepID=A0A3S2TVH3_9BACI|nr:sulfite exporter TauE/SafE family protein [Niallia taxi]MDK8643016.1 sulfite exporter TauE/SafE family protein [Niallia taxi]MED4038232.1 sulfite exporter TauE/SafE family protein [Niallia taxi]MED4055125.1 sulfite exporter TauE/SafE family protein [Niallia taxi]MED4120685.1 sulfite exporter TauE/SafE family protein [Niallia taxi]RVT59395.1 sulfite exporter TauE/SafE family protein [Niallia taxi]
MDITFIVIVFVIGFVGSFISGMLGIGGAIINYPMLLYIPVMLGVGHFTAHEVSGITAIQVFFATFGGVLAYRKGGFLNKGLIIYMGISILTGSLIGGLGSTHMSENGLNIVYGVLALIAVFMMFVSKIGIDDMSFQQVKFNKWLASLLAFIVGIGAGIVGAGGAFLLVPIMLVILKIPTRMTIASSLAITLISSIGAVSGKITTGQIPVLPAFIMIIASLIASPIGVHMGKRVNTKVLQSTMVILILATAVKTWMTIL